MFKLTGLSTFGYRAFPDRLDLELRPLTLLYGRNNAGKSAVLRLLPILADSVADAATSPFDIGRVAGAGASFLDVPARAGKAAGLKQMALALDWTDADGQRCRDGFVIKYIDEANQTIIAGYTCSGPDGLKVDPRRAPTCAAGAEPNHGIADSAAIGDVRRCTRGNARGTTLAVASISDPVGCPDGALPQSAGWRDSRRRRSHPGRPPNPDRRARTRSRTRKGFSRGLL